MSVEILFNQTISNQAARLILDYWFFEYPTSDLATEQDLRWFSGGSVVDQEIGRRFGYRVELALAGGFRDWENEPESGLALIILLDQFTRNIFRGSHRAFSGDGRALKLARRGQSQGLFESLPLMLQVFALMPLEHSELLSDQTNCVQGMQVLRDKASEEENPRFESFLTYALEHKTIIERFGRCPHRNVLLGRNSSDDEQCYLLTGKDFGQASTM